MSGSFGVATGEPPRVNLPRHSPHQLDLKARLAQMPPRENAAPWATKTAPMGRFQRMIEHHQADETLFCRLSERPRGWRNFPPPEAQSLGQALSLTFKDIFRNHPLSGLSAMMVVRMTAAALWRAATWPMRRLLTRPTKPQRAAVAAVGPKLKPVFPLMPLPAKTSGQKMTPSAGVKPLAKDAVVAVRPAMKKAPRPWTKRRIVAVVAASAVGLGLTAGLAYVAVLVNNKDAIMGRAGNGVDSLRAAADAAQATDFMTARRNFEQAAADFSEVEKSLGIVGSLALNFSAYLPPTPLSAASGLIVAGREIGLGGSVFAGKLAELSSAPNPADKLTLLRAGLKSARPHLDRALAALTQVNPDDVPPAYRDQVAAAKDAAPKLLAGAERADDALELMTYLVGAQGGRRLLIVFQNNAELRPTGGFIGSFAQVDVNRGKVTIAEMPGGGSYDLRGGLRERLISPEPLHLINPDWEFQDANWFADYPTSAGKMAWFYEKSGGPTVDGVIAMTATFMEKLLEVTGPVEMPEYGLTVDSRNFYFVAQKQSEIDYDKEENKPKQFLADLAPKLVERLLAADQATQIKLVTMLEQELGRKEVLLWVKDETMEQRVRKLGWGGELAATNGDYLSVVHTNIAGAKTDLMMEDSITHSAKILADGTGLITLTIKRTHLGVKNALFSGVRNVDYLRVYVPRGSEIIEATGFSRPDATLFQIPAGDRVADPDVAAVEKTIEHDRASGVTVSVESGKTVFGGWMQTDPGQANVVTLAYKLPPGTIRVREINRGALTGIRSVLASGTPAPQKELSYSLLVQKQPGAKAAEFVSKTDWPRGFRPTWQSPERQTDETGTWSVAERMERDQLYAAVANAN